MGPCPQNSSRQTPPQCARYTAHTGNRPSASAPRLCRSRSGRRPAFRRPAPHRLAFQSIGIGAVLVQAKDEQAKRFYMACAEFIDNPADSRALFLPTEMVVAGLGGGCRRCLFSFLSPELFPELSGWAKNSTVCLSQVSGQRGYIPIVSANVKTC